MINLIGRLFSKNKIGDVRYEKGSPFIIGSLCHLLPNDLWSNQEQEKLKFSFVKYEWTKRGWRHVGDFILTKKEVDKMYRDDKMKKYIRSLKKSELEKLTIELMGFFESFGCDGDYRYNEGDDDMPECIYNTHSGDIVV